LIAATVGLGKAWSWANTAAATLAQRPALALSLCKQAIAQSFDAPEAQATAHALPLADRAFSSLEAQEGVRAFLAKETPRFEQGLSIPSGSKKG
jgi:enoyl-CoA hydratase/carnithine racemase